MMWLLEQGGVVTWVIMGMGIIAFAVYLERSYALHRARIRWDDFLQGIYNILDRGNIHEAMTICDDTPGPVAVVVKTAIQHRTEPGEALRTAVKDATLSEISRMERRLVVITTVAQMTPMLGLLGTILAMVSSAVSIRGQAPLLPASDVMDAMLYALVSTAAGLSVAIPCHGAFQLLLIKVDRLVLDMERASLDVISYLRTHTGRSRTESEGPL